MACWQKAENKADLVVDCRDALLHIGRHLAIQGTFDAALIAARGF
jgi:hypothetical protein